MREMSEYILELKGITKIFPGVKALDNVHFQLKQGEIFINGEKVEIINPKDAQKLSSNNHIFRICPAPQFLF